MALDGLFRLEDEDALFVIGRGPGGQPEGFLHFALSPAGSALSLSSMPRLRTTPNGFNLLVFNRKFFPSWERRFLVYERRRDLPRVGLAALAAEAYLPFSGRDRR